VKPSDDRSVRPLEDIDDLAFGTPAPVGADLPRGDAVAMQHLVLFFRIEKQVGAAIVRYEETETVRVTLHGAGDEIELGGNAELALPIRHELPVALHGFDPADKRFARAAIDRHRALKLGKRQRHASIVQRVE